MLKILNLLIITIAFSSLFSCVANRKYQEEVEARSAAQRAESKAKAMAAESQEELEKAEKEIKKVEKELKTIEKDYKLVKDRYEQQQRLNKDLQDSYDKLLELNEKLTAQAAGRRRELSEELARKEAELRRKEEEIQRREREMKSLQAKMDAERTEIDRLRADVEAKTANISNLQGDKSALQKDLEAREASVNKLQKDLEAREARVKELEAAIAARDAKANALRDKVKKVLLGFNSSDLSVEMRNGKVYVSLSQNLLFATGSSKLDSKGADALTKLAEVLQKNKTINVMVEGHTDSDGEAKMNWELSTKRSLSIVHLLTKNDVKPGRITAAGRGEFAPIASNDTASGKAKNRRTDIILSPQLDEIMDILDK